MDIELPSPQGGGAPFFGDYIYISAVSHRTYVVWTDSRDMQVNPRSTRFDTGVHSCSGVGLACLASGAFDQNIYGGPIRISVSRHTIGATSKR